ncbi:MAG: hypothetical protein ABSC64_05270 [Candidatus Korobacteraceae bacterium]
MPEEGDHVFGMNNHTHTDLGLVVLNANPVQNTSAAGGVTYTDKMVYAKTAMRDLLANQYGCTGSADPAASDYCGSGPAATALAALNTAWYSSSVYTTWNTSDAGGLAGIHSGTYASYGAGTGFLDENGTHTLSSATKTSCLTTSDDAWGVNTAVLTDAHAFVASFATTYGQEISAAYGQSSVLPQPPFLMILYDGPTNVYTAMAPYFQGFWISPIHRDTAAARLAMVQSIIAAATPHAGNPSKAIIFADYATTPPDCFPGCTGPGNSVWPSRNAMGVGMVTDWQNILPLQDANGNYVVAGIEHWGWYDTVNAFLDGGLVSAFADNPYDGSASIATATHSDTWQNGHTYPAPSLIWDGSNYQALTFGATPASCTSGGSAPTWATKMGAFTMDGTCTWANEGPYTVKPEQADRIPGTATLPGVAYGDAITPISNFLNDGIGFQVSAQSQSLTITRGTPVTDTLTVTGLSGFSQTVNLSCSVSSTLTGTTCSVNPSSVTPGGTASLTVTASPLAGMLRVNPLFRHPGGWRETGFVLAVGILLTRAKPTRARRKRNGRWSTMLMLLLIVSLTSTISCGGGSQQASSPVGPQSGEVMVQASSGDLNHSVSIAVTVN